jgi:hypothetical protein
MVAYSFKAQFVAPIVAGTKVQTIRAASLAFSGVAIEWGQTFEAAA